MSAGRNKAIVVRVSNEAHEHLSILAKHYRLPMAELARQIMQRGLPLWRDDRRKAAR